MAKQPEDTKTTELPGLKRRGRPPAGAQAMTPAERQKAYRERNKDARWIPNNAIGELSRVQLMDRLSTSLSTAGDWEVDVDDRQGAAYVAEEILAEIVTRYVLDINHVKRLLKPQRVTK